MKLGIGSYTYGWATGVYGPSLSEGLRRMTAEELVEDAHQRSVQIVQIVNLPDLASFDLEQLEALTRFAKEKQVEIEVGTIGSDPEQLRRWIDVGKQLGSRMMRTIFVTPSEGLQKELTDLKTILPDLKEAGIRLAVENHETSSIHDLKIMVEVINDPYVGICLDTVNSLGRGEGVWEVAELLLPLTINLHVKDYTVTRGATDMGFTVTGEVTGQGKLDIPRLLREANKVDPEMSVILEQWTPLQEDFEASKQLQIDWADVGVNYLKTELSRI